MKLKIDKNNCKLTSVLFLSSQSPDPKLVRPFPVTPLLIYLFMCRNNCSDAMEIFGPDLLSVMRIQEQANAGTSLFQSK